MTLICIFFKSLAAQLLLVSVKILKSKYGQLIGCLFITYSLILLHVKKLLFHCLTFYYKFIYACPTQFINDSSLPRALALVTL